MRVLALEASTQAAKAIVYDREAGVASLAQLPYPEEMCIRDRASTSGSHAPVWML